ncbi:MAG: heme/copper-type cytochrome/quinol oxidase, subunit 3 [Nevskia sp.]|nr:heme/copper-type cytochrome/quinol oxidase, subunit 3 [Nevskia sp.]
MFGLLFVSFVMDRGRQKGVYEASRQLLNASIGGLNTLILLTSSWLVALGVEAARHDDARLASRCLGGAILCGLAFGISKGFEYAQKLHAGISLLSNPFFTYYYALTGIHLLHVVAGTVVLVVLHGKAKRGGYGGRNCTGLEIGASYWHMVDLLWIMLFPLLYLMR